VAAMRVAAGDVEELPHAHGTLIRVNDPDPPPSGDAAGNRPERRAVGHPRYQGCGTAWNALGEGAGRGVLDINLGVGEGDR
jgi:hypothetical protein